MNREETKRLARALFVELLTSFNISLCEWITETKLLAELPLTKRQLEKFRNGAELIERYHYKCLGKDKISKDGSRRGRRSYIYNRGRMLEFIDKV